MRTDRYGNMVCINNFNQRIHVELYIKNKNNDILIINHRAGSTSLITCALYDIGNLTKDRYDDPNFLFWKYMFNSKYAVFRKASIPTFQIDKLRAKNIYMVINSDIKKHIIRKLNHCKREQTRNNINDAITFMRLCNVDEDHNDYSNFHYISTTSLLRQLRIEPEKIKFVDISKIEDFSKMFFDVPYYVPRNVSTDKRDITWDDLTLDQQEELSNIYRSDRELFEKIKSNGNLII